MTKDTIAQTVIIIHFEIIIFFLINLISLLNEPFPEWVVLHKGLWPLIKTVFSDRNTMLFEFFMCDLLIHIINLSNFIIENLMENFISMKG